MGLSQLLSQGPLISSVGSERSQISAEHSSVTKLFSYLPQHLTGDGKGRKSLCLGPKSWYRDSSWNGSSGWLTHTQQGFVQCLGPSTVVCPLTVAQNAHPWSCEVTSGRTSLRTAFWLVHPLGCPLPSQSSTQGLAQAFAFPTPYRSWALGFPEIACMIHVYVNSC